MMKTPQQIAEDLTQLWRGQRDEVVFTEQTLIGALLEAIEADRAQHDLSYARTVILANNARAVIWEPSDLDAMLDQRIEEGEVAGSVTEEFRAAIIESATKSSHWRGLDSPSERDAELVAMALDEALQARA